jgi:hypothetical protein
MTLDLLDTDYLARIADINHPGASEALQELTSTR